MLFNEKFAIGHINFSTGWITVDTDSDEFTNPEDDRFSQFIYSFSQLIDGEVESLGMMQYRITGSPYDFTIQSGIGSEIIVVVENVNKIDETVKYIKESIAEINANILWE